MQLKTAATFLMIGAVTLVIYQLVMWYAWFFLSVHFYSGVIELGISALLDVSLAVICFLLGRSFRQATYQSIGRMTIAILLAVVSASMIISQVVNAVQVLAKAHLFSEFGLITMLLNIMAVLGSVALLLFGIALAGTNRKRQRRAYFWLLICNCVSFACRAFVWIYSFDDLLRLRSLWVLFCAELLTLLFPISCALLSLALLRRPDVNQLEEQPEEF